MSLLEQRFPELPARDAVFGALQAAKFDVTGVCAREVAPRCVPLSLGTGRCPGPHPFGHLPGLTTEQMLRKDLKVISNDEVVVAISGVFEDLEVRLGGEGETEAGSGTQVMLRLLCSVQIFLLRPGLLQDLESFCQSRGYAGLVAMTVSFNERHEPTRKLAVYSPQEPLRSTVSQETGLGISGAVPSCGLPQNLPIWGL